VREADILEAVNQRRRVLTLPEIADLTPDTKLDAGLSSAENAPGYNKKSALDDLKALSDAEKRFEEMGKEEAARIVRALGELDADNGLLAALQQRTFIETGLAFVDAPACPLCDLPWDEQSLRQHLNAKLSKSEHARGIQESLQKNGAALGQHASRVAGLLVPVQRLAEAEGDHAFGQVLILWKASLETLKGNVGTVEGLRGVKDRLDGGWLQIPGAFSTA